MNKEDIEAQLKDYEGKDKVISSIEMLRLLEDTPKSIQIKSKIPSLDITLGGFEGGEVTIISGKTGNGKTLLAQTLTINFEEQSIPCLWFSFEIMPRNFLKSFNYYLPTFYLPKQLKVNSLLWLEARIYEAILKYGIKVVFIDHLHFLIDIKGKHNMSLEIGFIMRSLKRVAIKHNICIFLITHIAKISPEKELDIEDCRDCLPVDQLVYVNGARKKINKIEKGDVVMSRYGIKKLQKDVVSDIWRTGKKKIYRLTTRTGRFIECSDGHKFFAMSFKKAVKFGHGQGCGIAGWTPLRELSIGQKIAVVKEYPDTKKEDITTEQACLLGWIIGDGHITKSFSVEITTHTKEEADFLKDTADRGYGLNCVIRQYKNKKAFRIYLTNSNEKKWRHNKLKEFLKEIRFNPVGKNKYVPDFMFSQSKNIIGAFLSGLFQADGYIGRSGTKNKNGEYQEAVIRFDNISERLVKEIQSLFVRIGIIGFVRKQNMKSSGFRSKNNFIWQVGIYGQGIKNFGDKIGFYCYKKDKYEKILNNWRPKEIKREWDIYYDKIKSIEYLGDKETFDISVRGHHVSLKNNSLCVNDFITHNSSFVGQESDNVIMIWRKKNTETEAYIKIVKNRKLGFYKKFMVSKFNGKLGEADAKY